MLEKIKKLWIKFNKKENEEKIEKKKRTKLSGVIGFVFFSLISTLVLDMMGVFDILKRTSISTGPSIPSTPIVKTIEEDFIIEDFIYENYIEKQSNDAYIYDNLKDVNDHFNTFINEYSSYSLKSLEGKEFALENNKYKYSDNKYTYIYDSAKHEISIDEENIIYRNADGIVSVKLDDYTVVLENTTLSFSFGNNDEYIFELEEDNFAISSSEGQIIEHYLLADCSLYYYETVIANQLYNTYVYEQIKNDTNIIYNEEDGKYYLESSNEEVYDYNFELDTPNYYVSEQVVYDINNQEKTIMCINVLQSYVVENGLPLGLSL